ncbi:MAG: isopentenyl-diphosphate Delta-isomerase [Actinomycetales bacterium]|nr:isopentenyl-diphosphate Delta-isomerase [Actinomycetales bacterium]
MLRLSKYPRSCRRSPRARRGGETDPHYGIPKGEAKHDASRRSGREHQRRDGRGRYAVHRTSADGDDVVLLDEGGNPIGAADRRTVHTDRTPLHLAFSTYLFDVDDRLLLTQRAHDKVTWPGVWTNSCCGHPRPGEDPRTQPADAFGRSSTHIDAGELRCVAPDFRYRAIDAHGVVEHEMCPVYVAEIDGTGQDPRRADPREIADSRWVPWARGHRPGAERPGRPQPAGRAADPSWSEARPPRSGENEGGDGGVEVTG